MTCAIFKSHNDYTSIELSNNWKKQYHKINDIFALLLITIEYNNYHHNYHYYYNYYDYLRSDKLLMLQI